jgi:hypothetical protein
MKKSILSLVILTSFLLVAVTSKAQSQSHDLPDYTTAVGLKFGPYESGFSIKYFAAPNTALEGIVGFNDHGVVVTGLYEMSIVAFDVPALKFFYGAGAHIGAEGSGNYDVLGNNRTYNNTHLLLGVDGVLGLEYKIPQAPIAISVDLDPRVELATGPFFDVGPALGLKYTF